jgi:hypothetical protein
MLLRDSNPQSQQASGSKPNPCSAATGNDKFGGYYVLDLEVTSINLYNFNEM